MDASSIETRRSPAAVDPAERIAGLTRVLEVTKHLAAEKDLDRLLDLVIEQACRTLHCERASLFLYDAERHELYSRNVTQLEQIEEIRVPEGTGIVGLAARERRTVHVADPYRHPLFNADFDRRTGFRTRNILAAPLISWNEEKLLGVLQLLNREEGPYTDVDEQLLGAFAAHAAIALERAILARHYEEKMQLLVSLEVAREIQAGFFPRTMPEVGGYELAGTTRPADATGGDYYDVIPVGSGQVGLVVADVSGHGLGPSLLMASVRATLRGLAIREAAPDALVSDLSQAMFDDLAGSRRFITLLYGALDPIHHRFDYANAGHGPVALHLGNSGWRSLVEDEARGCPLGILRQSYGACAPVFLEPGDLLVLGTDGVVETRRGGQCFGTDRLCEFIASRRTVRLEPILAELMEATAAFHEDGPPPDDLTMLMVRRK